MSKIKNLTALALACSAAIGAASAQAGVLAGGMKQLVKESETADARLPRHLGLHLTNAAGEPMVHVHLSKAIDRQQALAQLKAAGFKLHVASKSDPSMLEGYVSLRQAKAIAAVAGVKSVFPVQRPITYAGSVQSQAVALQKADIVQAKGIDGTGIKVAALSDSFDACTTCTTHAAGDVATGDLPANVFVQADLAAGGGEDEGRAMLQLVHDVAPGAQLAFATAFNGEVDFANQILALRSGSFGADIIVDDVGYFDEPMFSDGVIAQAVDQVVANGAAYYSSAGNNGLQGYESEFHPVTFAKAESMIAAGQGNLKLDQIPAAIRPQTIHMFKGTTPDGKISSLSNKITVAADDRISFQWDEPFNVGKVKTDYNIYVFDADGNWLDPETAPTVYYTTDDNTQTDEAYEYVEMVPVTGELHGGANSTTYQIVIGNVNGGPASHLKYIVDNALGESQFQGAPTIFGHPAATNAMAVAATYYAIPNFPEDFSASGPVTIYFDGAGNRLETPVVRSVPQITAADGVDTTFFGGTDPDGTGFPNFFGTSAAAPDAAATAALVLQAAGGSGSLTPAALNATLVSTATPLPVPENRMFANAEAGPVAFNARGDWTRWQNYFGLSVDASATSTVSSIVIDASALPLTFNTILARFNVGDVENFDASKVTVSCTPDGKVYTLTFAAGSFGPGQAFRFGTSIFNPLQGSVQEDPDRLRGLVITANMADGTSYTGTMHARPKESPNRFTGAGLVNAKAAVKAVAGR